LVTPHEIFPSTKRIMTGLPSLRTIAAALAFFGAPVAASAQAPTVTLLQYRTAVPAGWAPRTAASAMRIAEFVVPSAGGKDTAEVVVYYFGAGQGGGVDANLARWKGQFSDPTGKPVYEKVTRDSSGASPLTIAEYRGTYARGIGAGSAPGAARPNTTLIAAVAETPRGTLFFCVIA
jgi:hypothetical protein